MVENRNKLIVTIISTILLIALIASIIICSIYLDKNVHNYIPGNINNKATVSVIFFGCIVGISGFLFTMLAFNFLSFLSTNKNWLINSFKRSKNKRV